METKETILVKHPCEKCKKLVEVELWEAESSKTGYLITCEDDECLKYGMIKSGFISASS